MKKWFVILSLLVAASLVFFLVAEQREREIVGDKIFDVTFQDQLLGGGYIFHEYADETYLIPNHLRLNKDTSVLRLNKEEIQEVGVIARELVQDYLNRDYGSGYLNCVSSNRLVYGQSPNQPSFVVSLDTLTSATTIATTSYLGADCAISETPPVPSQCLASERFVSGFISNSDGWIHVCSDDNGDYTQSLFHTDATGKVTEIFARANGLTTQEDNIAINRLDGNRYAVVVEDFTLGEDEKITWVAGVIKNGEWIVPMQRVTHGVWFEVSRGFGAGNADPVIYSPQNPLVAYVPHSEQLFIVSETDEVFKVSEVKFSSFSFKDSCTVRYGTEERLASYSEDQSVTYTFYELDICSLSNN